MRGCMVLLTMAAAALAQDGTAVPAGVPLRVALDGRVAIKRVGQPIRGRLVEPVYVFDRLVLPAGTVVEGHIGEIAGVPVRRRIAAILNGDLTPPRDVRAQFDALTLSDGSRVPLRTSLARGTAHTVRIALPGKKQEAPGKMGRLKSTLFGMLPYRPQSWPAGARFNSVLQEPVRGPAPSRIEAGTGLPAEAPEVGARLLTAISSATARKGAPIEAAVTRPVFSPDHTLLIPEGSLLLGDIVEARPARRFHRNGKVLFVFRQVKLAPGAVERIQGYLDGVDVDFDAHLALDAEGAARASSPKTRFIFPAIAAAAAGLSFHQDYNAQGIPDQDIGGRAESGAVGLGLIGTLLAQASRTLASSIAIAGAGFSVYTTFIARGEDVVLPANTPVKVSLGRRAVRPAAPSR
jgi:hypothetical protein